MDQNHYVYIGQTTPSYILEVSIWLPKLTS